MGLSNFKEAQVRILQYIYWLVSGIGEGASARRKLKGTGGRLAPTAASGGHSYQSLLCGECDRFYAEDSVGVFDTPSSLGNELKNWEFPQPTIDADAKWKSSISSADYA